MPWYKMIDKNGERRRVFFNKKEPAWYNVNMAKRNGWEIVEMKQHRYSLDEVYDVVYKILSESKLPLNVTDLWEKSLNMDVFMSREVFMRKLKILSEKKENLNCIMSGNMYLYYIGEVENDRGI